MIRLSGNSQSASAAKINIGESIEGIPPRGGRRPVSLPEGSRDLQLKIPCTGPILNVPD